ncbi:MAG: carboxypeptidase-like regulatory domain-containing protein, partial [Cyclobacteriaceae bacterium]
MMNSNNSMRLVSGWALLFLLYFTNPIAAQDQQPYSGTVTDASGAPLPGVSVVIENTTQGAITDLEGNFTVPGEPGQVLVFTMVGM